LASRTMTRFLCRMNRTSMFLKQSLLVLVSDVAGTDQQFKPISLSK
jgi:hypothetical protein